MTIYWFTGDLYELGGEIRLAAAIYVGSKGQRLPEDLQAACKTKI